MRKLLVLSPHFPPVNAPDMQRIRLALPFLREHGWEPTVLALAPESVEGRVLDPMLERTYPADIRVIRVPGLSPRLTRWAGVGSLWLRCGRAYARAGEKLLREERFDLSFITTTQFEAFRLGPRWLERHGLPYVLDYQDPWVNPYYRKTGARPPGGAVKFAVSQWIARRVEPKALRTAAGLVAVSGAYGAMLRENYPWFDPQRVVTLPFGASEADFAVLDGYQPAKPAMTLGNGLFHHVYAGRCGPDMEFALRVLFRAFRRFLDQDPGTAERMRFHFVGTDYSPPPGGRDWAAPIARAEGVGHYVHEHRHRIPYFDTLHYLRNADALIALGSEDASYSASKLFPCMLARRPSLLILHEDSPVMAFARKASFGTRYGFRSGADPDPLAGEIMAGWFAGGACRQETPFNADAFGPFTAASLTRRLAQVFDASVVGPQPTG